MCVDVCFLYSIAGWRCRVDAVIAGEKLLLYRLAYGSGSSDGGGRHQAVVRIWWIRHSGHNLGQMVLVLLLLLQVQP